MIEDLKEKASLLPMDSGVYIMEDFQGKIIYIGKAKHLKNRVSQYFTNLSSHNEKTLQMVRHVENFRVVITKTEFDALLLEAQLIKQHKPKYNILLKDDKGYPFIRLGNEPYAKFTVENKKRQDKAQYFGPYSSRGVAKQAIDLVQILLQMPTCSKVFPRDFNKERPCLNHHMERCIGICLGKVSQREYDETLKKATNILEGKYVGLESELREKMMAASDNLEFEKAALFRDRINIVKNFGKGQGVFSKSLVDTDILGFAAKNAGGCLVKMSYIGGTLLDKETVFFSGVDQSQSSEIIESFIKQYYEAQGFAPKNILISQSIEDVQTLEQYVSHIANKKINIYCPQKGEKRFQIMLAIDNAIKELELREKMSEKSLRALEIIKDMIGIYPKRIESYDISHIAGDMAVCGMVVFENGRPLKRSYKRFKIDSKNGGDDIASLKEALSRRIERGINGDQNFLPFPDVILMDGGKAQVAIAQKEIAKHNLYIKVLGMVKDDKHRTKELLDTDGNYLGIKTQPTVFAFITRVQDEVHRYALDYHTTLRSKKIKTSVLDQIDGIGEERKKKLMKHFKTITAIRNASMDELTNVVPKNAAQNIKDFFENKE